MMLSDGGNWFANLPLLRKKWRQDWRNQVLSREQSGPGCCLRAQKHESFNSLSNGVKIPRAEQLQ